MSNARAIFSASVTKLQELLGPTYKPLMDQWKHEEEDSVRLSHGFSILLGKLSTMKEGANVNMVHREMTIEVTHRTNAPRSSTKLTAKLADIYDLEKSIIDSFQGWNDSTIGLLKILPGTDGEVTPDKDGEEQYLICKLGFKVQYFN